MKRGKIPMRRVSVLLTMPILVATAPVRASALEPDGGGAGAPKQNTQACFSEAERSELRALLSERKAGRPPAENGVPPLFRFPLQAAPGLDDPGFHGVSGFVDHDAAYPDQLLDYMGGARTYDTVDGYNHKGTDYYLWPFEWNKMDREEVWVVAASPGQIVYKHDGEYDRSCTLGGTWNAVFIEHADGSEAWYGHMKNGSLTPKAVGATVAEGEYLGVVGSSGSSTAPHLHFEVYDSLGNLIDPYDGPFNSLNATSWWQSQRAYYDSAVNAQRVTRYGPVLPACPGNETENTADWVAPLTTYRYYVYYRDQLEGQTTTMRLKRPDGTTWQTWTFATNTGSGTSSITVHPTGTGTGACPRAPWVAGPSKRSSRASPM